MLHKCDSVAEAIALLNVTTLDDEKNLEFKEEQILSWRGNELQ